MLYLALADNPNLAPRYCAIDFQHTLLAEQGFFLRIARGREGGKAQEETRYYTTEEDAKQAARALAESLIEQGYAPDDGPRDPWFGDLAPPDEPDPPAFPDQPDLEFEMGNYRVYTSNHVPYLLDRLADALRRDPLPPWERETIVAPSGGMRRWLTLELAAKLGVAASIWQPFPAKFFNWLSARVLNEPDRQESSPSIFEDRTLLAWRIFSLLPAFAADREFAAVTGYLDPDPSQRKRWQLARRLALCFDEYQLYRPDWLLAWERGERAGPPLQSAVWQGKLWRALANEPSEPSLARRLTRLRDALARDSLDGAPLPPRVAVFGVSAMPPMFAQLLAALSRHIPVSIYLISPTLHYWGDIRSEREASLYRRRAPRLTPEQQLHYEIGHPLLASLGKQGRDFFAILNEADEEGASWQELDYRRPAPDQALHALQRDILDLNYRTPSGDGARRDPSQEPLPLADGDRSIQVHGCHSPMREMEVLRDQLLQSFADIEQLRPQDVLVMAPDINDYAPYVQAVFGRDRDGEPRIPFTLADRAVSQEQPLTATLLRVFEAASGRLTAADALDLLDEPALRRRFGIGEEDLGALRHWVGETRIRWGRDARHRREDFDLPAVEGATWRAGVDRLMLGYAVGPVDELFDGALPSGEATAGRADLLGAFSWFVDSLCALGEKICRAAPLAEWSSLLSGLVRDFFRPGGEEEERALQTIRETLVQLAQAQETAALEDPVEPALIRDYLETAFADDAFSSGFIAGAVTFCSMKPMRAIPYKVICILGLNDGAFPRRDRPSGFNLIGRQPRRGDRSPRDDDRYLFLESILAAQERLILSYISRSQRDNKDAAPSVVLSELLDCLDQSFTAPGGGSVRKHVATEHPLQPFSARYFDRSDPKLFSYSRENCGAARTAKTEKPSRFIDRPLEVAGAADEEAVDLDDLIAFWSEPCRFFCAHTLGLRFPRYAQSAGDAEPFDINSLDRYWLFERLLRRRLGGRTDAEPELAQAMGLLPLAELGDAIYERQRPALDQIVRALPDRPFRDTLSLAIDIRETRLTGSIDGLGGDVRLQCRPSTIKPKDLIRAWIRHLALNARAERDGEGPRETLVIGRGSKKGGEPVAEARFEPVARPEQWLDDLVEGYRQGLSAPPPLFPQASLAFFEAYAAAADQPEESRLSRAIAAARKSWDDARSFVGDPIPGDGSDRYVRLCFRASDPIAEETRQLLEWAERLWRGLTAHKREKSR